VRARARVRARRSTALEAALSCTYAHSHIPSLRHSVAPRHVVFMSCQRLAAETALSCFGLGIVLLLIGSMSFGWMAFLLVGLCGINHRLRQHAAQERRDIHRIHRAANYRIREVMSNPPNWIRYSVKERVGFLSHVIKVLWPYMRTSIEQKIKLSIET
jgi:hypothetical protein